MGERTNISKDGSISVPSYVNSRQNRGTNNAKKLGSRRARTYAKENEKVQGIPIRSTATSSM